MAVGKPEIHRFSNDAAESSADLKDRNETAGWDGKRRRQKWTEKLKYSKPLIFKQFKWETSVNNSAYRSDHINA